MSKNALNCAAYIIHHALYVVADTFLYWDAQLVGGTYGPGSGNFANASPKSSAWTNSYPPSSTHGPDSCVVNCHTHRIHQQVDTGWQDYLGVSRARSCVLQKCQWQLDRAQTCPLTFAIGKTVSSHIRIRQIYDRRFNTVFGNFGKFWFPSVNNMVAQSRNLAIILQNVPFFKTDAMWRKKISGSHILCCDTAYKIHVSFLNKM